MKSIIYIMIDFFYNIKNNRTLVEREKLRGIIYEKGRDNYKTR